MLENVYREAVRMVRPGKGHRCQNHQVSLDLSPGSASSFLWRNDPLIPFNPLESGAMQGYMSIYSKWRSGGLRAGCKVTPAP